MEEDSKADDYNDQEEDEEVTYADHGMSLIIQRNLSVAREEEDEDWLRKNVFHTKCTSHGKVCVVIIDSGSFENVVSTVMVDKLGLKTVQHPHPYKLSWLQKDNEIKVNKRCLVSFSIGKNYKDEVWCDVAPMDACHLLLGRPWHYDRRILYDGYKHTYSFVKDGCKVVLGPSKPESVPKLSRGEGSSLLTQSECVKELKLGSEVYVLIVVEENEGDNEPPVIMKSILDEFNDVVPEEIPSGLPPMRDIQHYIDFVPGAALPNKAAYRMSQKEHEELQRQVDELLAKGMVRESMSPCAVPALLVPKKDGAWRMCIDSRAINKITVDYRFPIPRLDDLLDQLHGAAIFSKIYL